MSDQPAMELNISYYQRLLAMDQAEAAEIVEERLKSHSTVQIYDDILVPALNYARRDRGQADGRWQTICLSSDPGYP